MPKINNFLKGFQDGLPGMKDYRHANRLFTDDDFKLLPKQKFLFYCVIRTNEDVSMDDFSTRASDKEIAGLFRAVGEVARLCGVAESGYRIIANAGPDGHQEVPHLHLHVVGGAPSGPMLKRLDT